MAVSPANLLASHNVQLMQQPYLWLCISFYGYHPMTTKEDFLLFPVQQSKLKEGIYIS